MVQPINPFPKEVHQLAVHFVCVGPCDAVPPVLHYEQAGSLDQFGGSESRCTDWQNPIRSPLNDQCRHIHAGQVLAEVLMPCRHTSETGRSRGEASVEQLDERLTITFR
jgi:hypothetical protein